MSGNLDTNKLAAAVLLAGLIGMVTGKATEFFYDGQLEHPGHHEEGPRGYKIDVPEGGTDAGAGGGAAAAEAPDISALYATADIKAGEEFFNKKCTVCHTNVAGAGNKVGPNLHGVVGRKVASISDFNYSDGMKSHADRSWNWDEINHFLWSPRKWVPGTLMAFAGIPKDQERANVIAYLNSQGSSLPYPPVTAKKEEPKAADVPAASAGEQHKKEAKEAATDAKAAPAKADEKKAAEPAKK